MQTQQQSEFYHAGEDVASDGKSIVAVVKRRGSAGLMFDERVCTVSREQVGEVVRRLNRNPELAGMIEGVKVGCRP